MKVHLEQEYKKWKDKSPTPSNDSAKQWWEIWKK
jgi:hypothetical protein